MTDLADRYGTSRRPRRLAAVIGGALGLVVFAVVMWSFIDYATPEVRSGLVRYEVLSPQEATAEVQVVRASVEIAATCRLRALAADHSVVGESAQRIDSGPTTQNLQVTVRTEREAVSVVSDGCTTSAQSRPR